MKTPEQLKRETKALLDAAREQRLEREARARKYGPILDVFDALERESAPSDAAPPPRHPPKLKAAP